MKKSCNICCQQIHDNEIDKTLQIEMGDYEGGTFISKKSFYYHLECLNNSKASS